LVAVWVLVVEGLSWAAYLLLRPLVRTWPDRGFGASKAAGVLMVALGTWLLSWYGLARPSAGLAWIVAGAMVVGAIGTLRRRHRAADPLEPGEIVVGEGLWLATLAAFLVLRAASPALAGGEKFMDGAFVAASIRASTMPPVDPWLAGSGINYYFFGYWLWAQPARMLDLPPGIAYNLAMSTIPAQVAAATYSVGRLLTSRRAAAVMASIGLVWSGTWAGATAISTLGPAYDYWTPTRVIPGTINEFPFFSFFWGDLHPHVMAMPNFILCVGLCLGWLERGSARPFWLAAAIGASLGIAVTTSVWDLAPLGLFVAGALASIARWQGALATLGLAAIVAALAAVTAIPAALSMETGAVSMGLASTHSPWREWLLVQGGWLLPLVAAAVVASARRRPAARSVRLLIAVAAVLLVVAELVFVDDVYGPRFERMNVVFKLHLHAMLLVGLAWAWAFGELGGADGDPAPARRAARAALVSGRLAVGVSALAVAVYPLGALASRWAIVQRPLTLDGTAYLSHTHPDDRALILYAEREIDGQAVIAEAPGNQYEYAGRVSAMTGLPAVVGWAGHERLWRRTEAARQDIEQRVEMVRRLYEGDADDARRAIERYRIRYVVVGDAERLAYQALNVSTLDHVARVIFSSGETRLYEVSQR
jgi:uncharacterized membrane protein